ncbi:MAG: 30S ribosomal protein S20, partial [Gemmatimonadaceae bacterium]
KRFRLIELTSPVMPNIASAKKNMRKSRAAQVRNRAQRSTLRTALKKAKAENASPEAMAEAVTLLDRAARKGLVHKNAAARRKSRMAKAAAKTAA